MDSECSFHYTYHREWFSSFEKTTGDLNQGCLGDNHTCEVEGIGKIRLRTHDGCVKVLTNVKLVPSRQKNQICLGYLEKSGYSFSAKGTEGVLKVMKGNLMQGQPSGRHCCCRRLQHRFSHDTFTAIEEESCRAEMAETATHMAEHFDYWVWHCRMGQIDDPLLKSLERKGHFLVGDRNSDCLCDPCLRGKQTAAPIPVKENVRSKGKLDLVHSDVLGSS